jgi:hypothetical protein
MQAGQEAALRTAAQSTGPWLAIAAAGSAGALAPALTSHSAGATGDLAQIHPMFRMTDLLSMLASKPALAFWTRGVGQYRYFCV